MLAGRGRSRGTAQCKLCRQQPRLVPCRQAFRERRGTHISHQAYVPHPPTPTLNPQPHPPTSHNSPQPPNRRAPPHPSACRSPAHLPASLRAGPADWPCSGAPQQWARGPRCQSPDGRCLAAPAAPRRLRWGPPSRRLAWQRQRPARKERGAVRACAVLCVLRCAQRAGTRTSAAKTGAKAGRPPPRCSARTAP